MDNIDETEVTVKFHTSLDTFLSLKAIAKETGMPLDLLITRVLEMFVEQTTNSPKGE